MPDKPKRESKYNKPTIDRMITANIVMLYELHDGFKIRLIDFLNKESKEFLQSVK